MRCLERFALVWSTKSHLICLRPRSVTIDNFQSSNDKAIACLKSSSSSFSLSFSSERAMVSLNSSSSLFLSLLPRRHAVDSPKSIWASSWVNLFKCSIVSRTYPCVDNRLEPTASPPCSYSRHQWNKLWLAWNPPQPHLKSIISLCVNV